MLQARRKSNRRIELFLWQRRPQWSLNKLNNPQNCLFSCGSRPRPIRGFLGPPDFAPKRQLDRFSRFTKVTNRPTDRQIDHATPSVATGLVKTTSISAMRPNNIRRRTLQEQLTSSLVRKYLGNEHENGPTKAKSPMPRSRLQSAYL